MHQFGNRTEMHMVDGNGLRTVVQKRSLNERAKELRDDSNCRNVSGAAVAAMAACEAVRCKQRGGHEGHNEDAGYSSIGRLYAIGYIRGLREAVYAS